MKYDPNTISSGFASNDLLNEEFTKIQTALENTLSRDGSTPNSMSADLDMNSNDMINISTVNTQSLTIGGNIVSPGALEFSGVSKEIQYATAGQTVFTLTTMSYLQGVNNLDVYIQGVRQAYTAYTETSSTVVTFSEGLEDGDEVQFRALTVNDIGATTAAQVSYTPAGTGAVVGDVQDKLRESVSVKDFGAVGDGATDDAAAINLAINYAATQGVGTRLGGTVHFPPGNYILETALVLKSGVILSGSGINATTLQKKTQAGAYWMIETDGFTAGADLWSVASDGILHGFGINNMALYGAANPPVTATDRGGIRLYGKRYDVENVLIHNVDGVGFLSEAGDGVGQTDWRDMPEGSISDLFVYKAGDEGIIYKGPHDSQINSAFVSTCGADGVQILTASGYHGVCDIGIIHSYANTGRGIYTTAPIHAASLIGESNQDAGVYLTGDNTKVDWIQCYSNNSSVATDTSQCIISSASNGLTVGQFHASNANTLSADCLTVAGTHVAIDGIKIGGNNTATGSAIVNTGNFNSFKGNVSAWDGVGSTVLEVDGSQYCVYNLAVSAFDTLVNTSNDYRYSDFNIRFYEAGSATIWGGTTPTLGYRNTLAMTVLGRMNSVDYSTKSQARITSTTNGFLDVDSASTGIGSRFTKAATWETEMILTPDISEMHISTYDNSTDLGYVMNGPVISGFNASTVTCAAQVNTGVSSPSADPQAVVSVRMGR